MLILNKFLSKITNLNQKIMKILILSQFLSNHKFESTNYENVNFEFFIKNHKFESKNYENFNFESIFIKNQQFL